MMAAISSFLPAEIPVSLRRTLVPMGNWSNRNLQNTPRGKWWTRLFPVSNFLTIPRASFKISSILRLFFHLLTRGSSPATVPTPYPETVLLLQFTLTPLANDRSHVRTRRAALNMTTVPDIILTLMLLGAGTAIIKPSTFIHLKNLKSAPSLFAEFSTSNCGLSPF